VRLRLEIPLLEASARWQRSTVAHGEAAEGNYGVTRYANPSVSCEFKPAG
jgi:hypothetical protein